MNPILVLGAGRSSVSLLDYLHKLASAEGFRFSVADADAGNLALRTGGLGTADALLFEAASFESLCDLIRGHKVVISLLPPPMHPDVARACLYCGSNLLTASYESSEMRELAAEVKKAGLIFLNECGLDPGIDHMSAMEMIHEIEQEGGKILGFESYCGGLTADECDDNPFRYKISWNPRNVVLAGKSGGLFLQDGKPAFLPHQRLFAEADNISVPGWGQFEAYANRDSIPYAALYGLKDVLSLKRGTLRKAGFCPRWNVLIQSGMADESVQLSFPPGSGYQEFLRAFFPEGSPGLQAFCGDNAIAGDVENLFRDVSSWRTMKRSIGTPAEYLLDLIVDVWVLQPEDKDLVVMLHSFIWVNDKGQKFQKNAWFGLKGENSLHTAMAKTVGLPLGIASKLILNACISQKGLLLPLQEEIYQPVLKELSGFGIEFQQTTLPL